MLKKMHRTKTATGELIESIKAIETTLLEELGNLTRWLRNKETLKKNGGTE